MAKEKSYVLALLLLSLLLCLSSQVGVAEARRHTKACSSNEFDFFSLVTTGYSDSRCADKFPATPPPVYKPTPPIVAPRSSSPKGKGP
ncbi:Transmembrane protein [Hirschfeldia incana]|nr:Transmembrane protein [Hirschfeldia incana]